MEIYECDGMPVFMVTVNIGGKQHNRKYHKSLCAWYWEDTRLSALSLLICGGRSALNWSAGLIVAVANIPPAKRAYIRRKSKPTGPSPGPPGRFMRGVVGKARCFKEEIPLKIQEERKEDEDDAHVSWGFLADTKITEEFEALIPDPGNTRGHTTLYQRTLDYHWLQKSVLRNMLANRGESQAEILLQQDDMVLTLKQILQIQKLIAHQLDIELTKETGLPADPTGLDS